MGIILCCIITSLFRFAKLIKENNMIKKISLIFLIIIPLLLFGKLFKKNTISANDRYEYRTEFTVYFDQNRSSRIPDILKRNFTEKALIENYEIHKEIFNTLGTHESKRGNWSFYFSENDQKIVLNLYNNSRYKIRAVTLMIRIIDVEDSEYSPYYLTTIFPAIDQYADGSLSARINRSTYNKFGRKSEAYIDTFWWE